MLGFGHPRATQIAFACSWVGASKTTDGKVAKTLDRRSPTNARAARSASRAGASGRPIGMSTPIAAASGHALTSVAASEARRASSKRPSLRAMASHLPRQASRPRAFTGRCYGTAEQEPAASRTRGRFAELAPAKSAEAPAGRGSAPALAQPRPTASSGRMNSRTSFLNLAPGAILGGPGRCCEAGP